MQVIASQTKLCPFCAEAIQAQAIKCRFCGEFLNADRARAAEAGIDSNSQQVGDSGKSDKILFEARPSLWAMTGTGLRGLLFLMAAGFMLIFPLENLSLFELSDNQAVAFGKYRLIVGLSLAVLVLLVLLLKAIWLKSIHYEITADRVEWSRGIFDRKIDNLDMFRVIDLKLRRSLFDCIVGIGTVGLITTDKTDPAFTFRKLRGPRRLYDIIKKSSLEADKKRSVVHLE